MRPFAIRTTLSLAAIGALLSCRSKVTVDVIDGTKSPAEVTPAVAPAPPPSPDPAPPQPPAAEPPPPVVPTTSGARQAQSRSVTRLPVDGSGGVMKLTNETTGEILVDGDTWTSVLTLWPHERTPSALAYGKNDLRLQVSGGETSGIWKHELVLRDFSLLGPTASAFVSGPQTQQGFQGWLSTIRGGTVTAPSGRTLTSSVLDVINR